MAELPASFAQFEASVLRTSSAITPRQLHDWIRRKTLKIEVDSNKSIGERLDPHSGPRQLLDYQHSAVAAAMQVIETRGRCLLSLPTGSGKTYTCLNLILNGAQPGHQILWLAPQTILVEQALAELRRVWWERARGISVRVVDSLEQFDSVAACEAAFAASTIQSVLRAGRSRKLDWLIVDEAHYLTANEFGSAVERLCGPSTRLIGLSATPGRGNAEEILWQKEIFGNALVTPKELGEDPVEALVRMGVYAKVKHIRLENLAQTGLEKARAISPPRPIDAACSAGRLESIVQFVGNLSDSDRCIVFGYSLAHCELLAAALNNVGVAVEVVSSRKPESHNLEAMRQFRTGQLRCLVNVKYIATGADFPSANVAVLAVPVGSPIQFEQVVGRVTRGPAVGGTASASVADFDNHFRLHSGIQAYARFAASWAVD